MASAKPAELRTRRRGDYPYVLDYRLRWNDNDMYQHVNNSVYNMIFDSAINAYMLEHCGLRPATSPEHGLAATSSCDFFAAVAYPAVCEVGVRVAHLGRSSVRFEAALFEQGRAADADGGLRAVYHFVHVMVRRDTQRPGAGGMSEVMRRGLERIYVGPGTPRAGEATSKL